VTIEEAAKFLSVGSARVLHLLRTGKLIEVQKRNLGDAVNIDARSVQTHLAEREAAVDAWIEALTDKKGPPAH
jgi:hypothetical protein